METLFVTFSTVCYAFDFNILNQVPVENATQLCKVIDYEVLEIVYF